MLINISQWNLNIHIFHLTIFDFSTLKNNFLSFAKTGRGAFSQSYQDAIILAKTMGKKRDIRYKFTYETFYIANR